MKKILLLLIAITTVLFANAQGEWVATGDGTVYAASTEIPMDDIKGFTIMHSDASGITDQTDEGAEETTYGEITFNNATFVQGSTNGMYYAFVPELDGTVDFGVKMSSNKRTFVLELTDALWTAIGADANDIASLTAGIGTADAITGDATFFTLPQVYDTYNNTTGPWDGTVSIQESGSSAYMIMEFPVVADKTYVLGCFGSKMMVRGVNYAVNEEEPNAVRLIDDNAKVVKTEYYNILGVKISEPANGLNIVKRTYSNGAVRTSKSVFRK